MQAHHALFGVDIVVGTGDIRLRGKEAHFSLLSTLYSLLSGILILALANIIPFFFGLTEYPPLRQITTSVSFFSLFSLLPSFSLSYFLPHSLFLASILLSVFHHLVYTQTT